MNDRKPGIHSRGKLKIVLEGMVGTISVSDFCKKYDLRLARF